MWFATDAGITRFDGGKFENYTIEDGLVDNEVYHINVDERGTIWAFSLLSPVVSFKGGRFHTKFSRIFNKKDLMYGVNTSISNKGNLWISNHSNFYIIDNDSIKLKYKRYTDIIATPYLIKELAQDTVLIIGKDCILKTTSSKMLFKRNLPFSYSEKKCFITKYNDSILVAYYSDSVFLLQINSNNGYSNILKSVGIKGTIKDVKIKENKLFIATISRGIIVLDSALNFNDKFSRLAKLSDYRINRIYFDVDDNLWILTSQGILFIDNNKLSVTDVFFKQTKAVSLMKYGYQNKKIIICDNNGLIYIYDTKTLANDKIINTKIDQYDLIKDILLDDNQNCYWIKGQSLYKCAKKSLKIEKYDLNVGALKQIELIDVDILVSSSGGLYNYNTNNNKIATLIDRERVVCAKKHYQKYLYGTYDGLYEYNENAEKKAVLDTIGRVLNIYTCKDIIWVVSANRGVYAIKDNIIYNVSKKNGLASNICRYGYVDLVGDLWIVTSLGISHIHFDREKKQFLIKNLGLENGIISNENYAILKRQNKLLVAFDMGIYAIDDSLRKDINMPIHFNKIIVDGIQTIIEDTIQLAHYQNNFSINFSCNVFGVIRQILSYQYRIMEVSDIWIDITTNQIEIGNLKSGTYTLEVRPLINGKLLKNENTKKLFLIIHPAFWQKLWFKLLVFLIIAIIVAWYFDKKRRELYAEYETKRKFAMIELQHIKSLLNPHFIYNTLNSIQSFINKNDKLSANLYLSDFADLMRKTLHFSSIEEVILKEEIAYLENYIQLEHLRFQKKFLYHISVNEEIDIDNVLIPTMLIQPFVENAIIHGLASSKIAMPTLTISFYIEDKILCCKIHDNGIGRKATNIIPKIHKSMSSDIINRKIELMKQNMIYDISLAITDEYDGKTTEPMGTSVVFKFNRTNQIFNKKSRWLII